jgi:hypothetical protein
MRLGSLGRALCGIALVACGYPDFQFGVGSTTTSVGGSTGGSGGSGGTAGAGKGAGGAGAQAGAAGSGGSANTTTTDFGGGGSGGAGPICELGTSSGCLSTQKCSVVDPATGELGCVTAGSRPDWSKCMQNADCGLAAYCEGFTRVCKPICDGADDCVTHAEAQCVQAQQGSGDPVVGLTVCTAHCNPIQTPPCDGAHGAVTCGYRAAVGALDCFASGNVGVGDSCTTDADCAPGLACTGECREWCQPPGWNNGCGVIEDCEARNPAVYYEGEQYGVCDPW